MPGVSGQALVIVGEAPESDTEDDFKITSENLSRSAPSDNVPEQSVEGKTDTVAVNANKSQTLKHDTLLHRMLRSTWSQLHSSTERYITKIFGSFNFDVNHICDSMKTTQATFQDASYRMRSVTENLYTINDQLDIILSYEQIPDIVK